MEDVLKQPSSAIKGGQHLPTCVSETSTSFAPFVEDKVLIDQDTQIGDSTWIRYGSELRNAVVSRHVICAVGPRQAPRAATGPAPPTAHW